MVNDSQRTLTFLKFLILVLNNGQRKMKVFGFKLQKQNHFFQNINLLIVHPSF